ncbi:hypothetical protein HDV06_002837 [Boothiomyces sp. JEL0866]|nr:hypothetical protein HDV06_002837 [Boothiomyces sp. JEL0866]
MSDENPEVASRTDTDQNQLNQDGVEPIRLRVKSGLPSSEIESEPVLDQSDGMVQETSHSEPKNQHEKEPVNEDANPLEHAESPIEFSNAFHYLITHPDHKILDSIMEFEEKIRSEQQASYEQYRETIDDIQQPIKDGNIVEIAQERKRQQQELQLYLDGYINQLNVNLNRQRKLYKNLILKTYCSLLNLEYTEEAVEELPKQVDVQVPKPEPVVSKKEIPKPVMELMDMGFEELDAASALEMAKNSMEGAVMLLLESPEKVKEYTKSKILTKPRFPKTMEQNSVLRKSSSNSNIFEDKTKPKSNSLSEKRSFSLSKLVGNESPKPSRASPFSNFLEKMSDAFKIEDEGRASDVQKDFTHLSETFTIYSGTQQIRNMYNIQLKVVERGSFFKLNDDSMQNTALRLSTYSTLYSSTTSAIILLVNENELSNYGKGKANKALFDYCMLHPEFHFDSVFAQLPNSKIQEDEPNGRTPLIQGYRSILELCHYTNITSITVPMIPMPVPEKIRLDTTIKRSEVLFKQSKGLFNELSRNEKVSRKSRSVVFTIPQSSLAGEAFNGIREKLVSTFRTG